MESYAFVRPDKVHYAAKPFHKHARSGSVLRLAVGNQEPETAQSIPLLLVRRSKDHLAGVLRSNRSANDYRCFDNGTVTGCDVAGVFVHIRILKAGGEWLPSQLPFP